MTIVENVAPRWADDDQWRLSAEPTLSVGDGSHPGDEFVRVSAVFHLGARGFVVVDARALTLRAYDDQGEVTATAGGLGAGPGEFRSIVLACKYRGDSLAIRDGLLGRLSVFDSALAFVRTEMFTIRQLPDAAAPAACFTDGSFLLYGISPEFRPDGPRGRVRPPERLFRYVPDSAIAATLLWEGPGTEVYAAQVGGPIPAAWHPLFARSVLSGTYPGGYFVGVNDTYELRFFDPSARLQRIVRRLDAQRRVTPEATAVLRDLMIEELEGIPYAAVLQNGVRTMPIPELMPAFGQTIGATRPAVLVDAGGFLWVLEYHFPIDAPQEWDVFDPDGIFQGTVTVPVEFAPLDIGRDDMLGVWTDADGVQSVRRYEVVKPR